MDKFTPGGSVGKESACNAGDSGDPGSIPGWGRQDTEATQKDKKQHQKTNG